MEPLGCTTILAVSAHFSSDLVATPFIAKPISIILRQPQAASKPGLAFVGWTRSTAWAKTAFQSLPPLADFVKIRSQPEFQIRCRFETEADALHDAFMARRGVTEETHIQDHHRHFQSQLQTTEDRTATQDELEDVTTMLQKRGAQEGTTHSIRCVTSNPEIQAVGSWFMH